MDNPVGIPEKFLPLGDNSMNVPGLIQQIRTGGVIPFVGAGMSVDFGFPQWKDFRKFPA